MTLEVHDTVSGARPMVTFEQVSNYGSFLATEEVVGLVGKALASFCWNFGNLDIFVIFSKKHVRWWLFGWCFLLFLMTIVG